MAGHSKGSGQKPQGIYIPGQQIHGPAGTGGTQLRPEHAQKELQNISAASKRLEQRLREIQGDLETTDSSLQSQIDSNDTDISNLQSDKSNVGHVHDGTDVGIVSGLLAPSDYTGVVTTFPTYSDLFDVTLTLPAGGLFTWVTSDLAVTGTGTGGACEAYGTFSIDGNARYGGRLFRNDNDAVATLGASVSQMDYDVIPGGSTAIKYQVAHIGSGTTEVITSRLVYLVIPGLT